MKELFADNMCNDIKKVDSNKSTFRELTKEEIANQVSGGLVLCWLGFGAGVGYLIDKNFIKPLWNN